MKSLLYSILFASFYVVSCCEAGHFEDNEVNLDANYTIKKLEKAFKPSKLRSDFQEGNDIVERQSLINHILNEGYDKRNYPNNMTVKLGVSVLKLDVDERKSTLETDVWIRMMWTDKRLSWDKKDFNVDVLRMSPGEVWHPDTTLYNSATPYDMMKCADTNILIYPTGDVLWVPPCHLSALCNLTVNTDPYGPQKCMLKFGSWTFDAITMDLQIYNNETKADVANLWDTTQWALISNEITREVKYYDCCIEPYVSLSFNLTVQRKLNPTANYGS